MFAESRDKVLHRMGTAMTAACAKFRNQSIPVVCSLVLPGNAIHKGIVAIFPHFHFRLTAYLFH
jgi:hypothetical protein